MYISDIAYKLFSRKILYCLLKKIPNTLFLVLCVVFAGSAQTSTLDSLKKLLLKADKDTTKVNILIKLTEAETDMNIWPGYNAQALQLIDRNMRSENKAILATSKRQLAGCLINSAYILQVKSKNDSALPIYNKVLKLAAEIGDTRQQYYALNNMAGIYLAQGDYSRALNRFADALNICEKKNDRFEVATILNNMGNIYKDQKDFDKAIEFMEKSMQIYRELNNTNEIARMCNNISLIYTSTNQPDKALHILKKGLASLKPSADITVEAAICRNLGSLYNRRQMYDTATTYVRRALYLSLQSGIPYMIGTSYILLGDYFQCTGRNDSSLYYLEKAFAIGKENNISDLMKNAASALHSLYSKKGDFRKAYEYLNIYKQISDRVMNEETRKNTMKQALRYEFEKKEALNLAEQKRREELAKSENQKQRTIIWLVSIGLLGVLGFAVFAYYNFLQKRKAHVEISSQKHIIEEKQKEIVDSIHYAERIQRALLAGRDLLDEKLGNENYFVLFRPKDIVSGDFYWATSVDSRQPAVSIDTLQAAPAGCELFYLAVCDSTGHGVPGAFMSLLNIGFLSEAVKEKNILEPAGIFGYVRRRLIESISGEGQKDGFDGILVRIEKHKGNITVHYSAANNSPVLFSDGKLSILPCDKMPVGKGERTDKFTTHTVSIKRGDLLYLFTDGFADQFGGPKGKKFKYRQLEELLLSNAGFSMEQQKETLEKKFVEWKGNLEQVDDVCIIGIKL